MAVDGTRAVLLVIVSVALSTAGQTSLKLGLDRLGASDKGSVPAFLMAIATNPLVILGLALFVGSVLVWMRVLADNELSWAYPLLGLSYVFVALTGWLLLGDRMTAMRVAGIAFVVLGAFLVARS
jgi:multidrug transporter EmrE-like cation transporter